MIRDGTLFTYLDEELLRTIEKLPSTNNQIEGGVNARLRGMLREHRCLNIEGRIKIGFLVVLHALTRAAFCKGTVKGNANRWKYCGDIQKALAAEKDRKFDPDMG